MGKLIVGIDIGGMSIKGGIFDTEGNILHRFVVPTNTQNNGNSIVLDMVNGLNQCLQENNINKKDIIGIGITVPGPVVENKIVLKCINLYWKTKRDLQKEVLDLLDDEYNKNDIIIVIGNDARLAALGEFWKGAGNHYNSAAFITIGTGIGGGIVLNGKVLTSNGAVAGEVGHIHVVDNLDYCCNCGANGCLEQMCAVPGIMRRTFKLLKTSKEDSTLRNYDKEKLTCKDIFDEAKKGDALSLEIVNTTCKYLGIAIANLTAIVDPDVFLIGGGVSKAGDFLINKIDEYRKQYNCISTEQVPILLATLGNDAGMYGAVKLVLDK